MFVATSSPSRHARGAVNPPLLKYPRTPHVEGSRLQAGDDDLARVAFDEIADRALVIEEKVDGANAALSFGDDGTLLLQSRGHYLSGGPREVHFDRFKQWAHLHATAWFARLGARYIVYGEWLYAKHTIFYDALPSYFLEFDVFDRSQGDYLSTPRRRELLAGTDIVSVPVLHTGRVARADALAAHIGPSRFKSQAWRERLADATRGRGLDVERAVRETDPSDEMEGLYIKVEDDGRVVQRLKWVRASFLAAVSQAGGHWLARPIVPNGLADASRRRDEAP